MTRYVLIVFLCDVFCEGNDFFRLWLDPSMMYSSARWNDAETLEQVQQLTIVRKEKTRVNLHLRRNTTKMTRCASICDSNRQITCLK